MDNRPLRFLRVRTSSRGISFESSPHSTVLSVMTRTRPARTVRILPLFQLESMLTIAGGQIGHRKYDCPEQRNFTANIICRVCGNAGHMARDCPDRQRGSDWRNNNGGFGGRRAIGGGDAVDREMEVCFLQFLSSIQYTVLTSLSNSCKNCLVARPAKTAMSLAGSRLAPIKVMMTAT